MTFRETQMKVIVFLFVRLVHLLFLPEGFKIIISDDSGRNDL